MARRVIQPTEGWVEYIKGCCWRKKYPTGDTGQLVPVPGGFQWIASFPFLTGKRHSGHTKTWAEGEAAIEKEIRETPHPNAEEVTG